MKLGNLLFPLGLGLALFTTRAFNRTDPSFVKVNTSSPLKIRDFEAFLDVPVKVTRIDLPEPDADPITVVRYKASQFEGVIVDDTSLDIEGAKVGVNIRWLLDQLPLYQGKKAKFVSLIAQREGDKVNIYRGEVCGQIVAPRGENLGFRAYFQPQGSEKTLGEGLVSPNLNARYQAIQQLKAHRPTYVMPILESWEGSFQNEG